MAARGITEVHCTLTCVFINVYLWRRGSHKSNKSSQCTFSFSRAAGGMRISSQVKPNTHFLALVSVFWRGERVKKRRLWAYSLPMLQNKFRTKQVNC